MLGTMETPMDQIMEMFGAVNPNPHLRKRESQEEPTQAAAKFIKGKGKGKGKKGGFGPSPQQQGSFGPPVRYHQSPFVTTPATTSTMDQEQWEQYMQTLLAAVARLALRVDNEVQVLKQDFSLVLWMRPGEHTALQMMFNKAKEWKDKAMKTDVDETPTLRTTLAIAMVQEVINRVGQVAGDADKARKLQEVGWRDPTTGWPYQKWDPESKMLVTVSERAPLKDMEILQLLEELKTKLLGQTVMRFHSTRPLSSDMKGLATFLLEISQRSKEAQRAWELLHVLMGSSVWQLTAVQYKREGWKKSILNKMVREYLGEKAWRLLLAKTGQPVHIYHMFRGYVEYGKPGAPWQGYQLQ
ncbi:unnamed protein product [Symbiodinium sp. CCMP2592]|nr:unnamed protein product [Symbiodinium sp. CCMP2592]